MRHIIVVICASLLAGCGPSEPLHKGKPASHWKQGLQNTDPQVRQEAISAMGGLRVKEAVPELIGALKDNDDPVRAKAAEALWALGKEAKDAVPSLVPLLKDRNSSVRLNAVGALGEIGPDAAAAVKPVPAQLPVDHSR